MASSLGPIFLFLLATLQLAPGMRVDPERIWARLRIEAGTSANADALQSLATGRSRRQLIGGSPKEETIQVTAPLFSSRLFEYGTRAGDKEITSGLDVAKKLQLSRPLAFFGQSHPALWVLSNGAIGFEQAARQYRANILPSASPMIAPFWNRNDLRNGGRVFYREVATGGRVLERGQSEIRYQYDLEVKVHSAIVVTFEKMQPVGTEPLPDENTNTFQVALFLTSNGTFANFIYSNIGWTQGAEAGFNAGDGNNNFFALPTSGTGNIMYLEDYGNTGIPGEWMFILGEQRIQRCKAGIKGDTCDEACAAGEWGPDCVRCCHCTEEKAGCHEATGECKQGSCAKCWLGIGCQQRDSRCGASQQRQCGQNAVQMTDYNRCGEPQQRCECLAGYQGDDPYTECTDIDECARPNACHQKAQCTNTPGRFFCQCQEGFQGDGVAECVASFLFPFDQSHHLPNDRHGRVEWQLKHPLRIFGRERDSLWLTSNGLILVKGAKNVPTKSGERISLDGMDVQGIAPFFAPIDLAQQQGGQIYVEETTDPRILAKASQLVNEQLGVDQQQQQQQFVASHALLVTYVNVSVGKQAAHQPKATNTFQTLLIGGKDRLKRDSPPMTFVEFLYRDLHWSEDAEAGIMAPDKANSILLPGSGTEGIEQLSQLSNVRSQGIWLYRIDGIAPSACMQADLQPPYCDARSPPLINRSPPPSTPSSSTLAVSSSQTPKKTSPAPPTPSTTFIGTTPQIQQSFGLEDDEELEPVVEQEQSQEMRPSRPELPKVEQNGWIPVEKKQPQPMAGKKPAIVQIQSREFEEMPPDAFDDGTVSRATTRAQEEEKPVDEDIREIVPSLIVPELVKPVSSGVPRQGPPPTSLEGQGQANVKETSVEEATAPRKIPPPPQIRIEQHKPVPITPFTPFTTTQSTSSTTPMDDEETTTSLADEEPMQTIGVDESEEQPTEAIPEQPAIPELVNTEPSPVPSQTVPSAVSTEASSRIFVLFNTTKKPVMSTSTKKMVPKPPMPEPPKQKPENPDGDEPILMDWDQQGNPLLDGTGTAGSKLSIVVPIAIVLVWLVVLVVVAVFLCCRRRQTQERLRTLYGPAYQIRPVYTMRVNKLNGFSGTGTTGEGSYEEHLEKAAQRLSAEMAYNPNPLWAGPGRYSLYGSYWNISPEGSAAGRVNGAAGSKQRPTTTTTTGAAMDISSPRSHESGGAGAGHASASANANGSSLFGNYVQQQLAGGGGHRTGGSAGTTAANGGEQREAAQSEYFSSQLPKRSQPDKPVAIRPGRELKLMKSDCKVYEVGSYVEICLDEFGKPVDEQTVVTPPTPPSTSAYEEDIETYSHVDQSQESIVTVPPEAGMASMQSIESPTDMLSGDDDRSQQSPSVMTPNTSIMTPNTSLVAPTKSLMSKAEEEDIYAVE